MINHLYNNLVRFGSFLEYENLDISYTLIGIYQN